MKLKDTGWVNCGKAAVLTAVLLLTGVGEAAGAEAVTVSAASAEAVTVPAASIQTRDASKSDGLADRQTYGIGSTSKMAVSAAVMKLADEGKIRLDEPLITYIPELWMEDEAYTAITPRMLLDHSSGLQGSSLSHAMMLGKPDTYNHDTLLTALRLQRLKALPGEYGTYCNDGFTLAEILVERVSGVSFTEYIDRYFKQPLGLSAFDTPQSPGILEKMAAIYDKNTGRQLPAEMANVIGSGGICSTAEDVCRFGTVFMEGSEVLSGKALAEMEISRYKDAVNPDDYDSVLSYGLGWDSVDTYPFHRYGIKALVKDGDTTYYHSSLTVLPEEKISCAVLTSGGSSTLNQLAVTEIVMTYLDEIGRIEREVEKERLSRNIAGTDGAPPDAACLLNAAAGQTNAAAILNTAAGWYGAGTLFELSSPKDGTVTLTNVTGDGKKSQIYKLSEDGRLISDGNSYISLDGTLTKSSNGRVGTSFLEVRPGVNDKTYLMAGTYETYPGLGTTAGYLPIAERLEDGETAENGEFMEKWSGKEFYLVSEPPEACAYLTNVRIKPVVPKELPDYLLFADAVYPAARICNGNTARFFQQIPGQAGRDLKDYTIRQEEGKTYFDTGDYRYVSEDDIEPFYAGDQTVTIGENGMTVWYDCKQPKESAPLSIEAETGGAWFVYHHTSRDMDCVLSSFTAKDGEAFLVPEDGKIAFVGAPGTTFTIRMEK